MSATPPPSPSPLSRPAVASSSSPIQSKLLARFPALQRLHVLHPSVPLPTLVVSFGVLHELTAILPVVGLFYGLRSVGGGQAVVDRMIAAERAVGGAEARTVERWLEEGERKAERVGRRYGFFGFPKTVKGAGQGQEGLLATAGDVAASTTTTTTTTQAVGALPVSSKDLAGDVANAVAAYMLTKVRPCFLVRCHFRCVRLFLTRLCQLLSANALFPSTCPQALLPARIAASIYLAPPFAKAFLLPIGRLWATYVRRRA